MVRHIFARLTAPIRSLHQAAYVLAGLTLAAQLLSLVRDRVFASMFGAGEVLDLYYSAFKIPDLVFTLVASLVSAYVLIPRLASALEDKRAARDLLSQMTTFMVVAGGGISIVLALFAAPLLEILFPNLMQGPYAADFVFITRILLLQPILLGLSGIWGSVTQLKRRFFLFALSPILYNLGIIVGAVTWYPSFGLTGIAFGVMLGAVLHMLVHVPVLIRAGLLPRIMMPERGILCDVFRNSVPRSCALSVSSLVALVLVAIASRLEAGSIAVFTFAGNLSAVPLSLVGAAYATAAFPVLSEQVISNKRDAFAQTLMVALRHIIFWSAVLTVLIVVLRAHIVRVVLGAGAFDWNDTLLTAAILGILSLGLLAQGIALLCMRAFYAAAKSWTPLLIQLTGGALSIAASLALLAASTTYPAIGYFLEALLRTGGVSGSVVLLIALGTLIGQLAMGLLSLVSLHRVAPGVARSIVRPLCEGLGAAVIGGSLSYGALTIMGAIAPLTSLVTVFAQGLLAGMVGLLAAGFVLTLLENREFTDLVGALRKIPRAKALAPYSPVHDRTDP